MTIKKIAKLTGRIALGFMVFVALYAIVAYTLPKITLPAEPNHHHDVSIYILSNGIHTDIVVPLINNKYDWRPKIKFENTVGKDTCFNYLAMGWGDKGFYLNTSTWAQLKFSVAFRAAFGLSTSAIHATFYKTLTEGPTCRKILISNAQYWRLVTYINNSFKNGCNGGVINIKTRANYNKNDAFYEANRRYNLFYTCNTWANNALKACGQKACFWTPFDTGIFEKYR